MPASSGSSRKPPLASSVVEWNTVLNDPDRPYERFQDKYGAPVSAAQVEGAAALTDSHLGGEAVLGQAFNYPKGFDIELDERWTGALSNVTVEDFYADHADAWLEEEGFYDRFGPRGYTYDFDPTRTDEKGRSGTNAHLISSIDHSPAPITLVPTSSIFPPRPRTVGAGWDSNRQCLTVIFRDGTFYNYYDVSGLEWSNFKRARSKGKFIYTYLDGKVRGTASMSGIPQAHQEALYRVARTAQAAEGGFQYNQSKTSKRGTGKNRYGSKNTASRSMRKQYARVEKVMERYSASKGLF